jgi:hypothetical protein
MINPLGTTRGPNQAEKAGDVNRWIVEGFGLAEDATVFVSELRCGEPGGPPVETIVAVMRRGQEPERVTFKLPIPLDSVTESDIATLRLTGFADDATQTDAQKAT